MGQQAYLVVVVMVMEVLLLLPTTGADDQAAKLKSGLREINMTTPIVAKHNQYRTLIKASNMVEMTWSKRLELEAAKWVNKCEFKHQKDAPWGENLYRTEFNLPQQRIIYRGINAWTVERSFVSANSCCDAKLNTTLCCNYQQMVWYQTRYVGCAMKKCPLLRAADTDYKNAWFFACYYEPRGNVAGMKPYVKDPMRKTCVNCPPMFEQCKKGLCNPALVTLKEGNYSFPCDTTGNFRIDINCKKTIIVRPSSGYVDIYGSFLNSDPTPALNEFKTQASSQREAIIYVKDESRPLYLSISSQAFDPAVCQAGSNYDIIVQNTDAIQPDALVTCYENGAVRECTFLDFLSTMYKVVQPPSLSFPSPCEPNHPGFYPHPSAHDRFIYCDHKNNTYVVFCPSGNWYNDNVRQCIPGTPPPILLPSTTTTTPTTTTPIPTTTTTTTTTTTPRPVISTPSVTKLPEYNPCTPDALRLGLRFFPYPPDVRKFIACSEWPDYGMVRVCASDHKWSQHYLTCIYVDTVEDPKPNVYVTSSPKPLDVGCRPGLKDGDLFYHPYPADPHKFIQCDQFGNSFVMDCAGGSVWNQEFLTCV